VGYDINGGIPEFPNDTTVVIKNIGKNIKGNYNTLTLFKNGDFSTQFPKMESDTGRLHAFPGHETDQKKVNNQSISAIGVNENGLYYMERSNQIIIEDGILSNDAIYNPYFYFTGFDICINNDYGFEANTTQRDISKNNITVFQNETVKIELVREKSKILLKETEAKGEIFSEILFQIATDNPDYQYLDDIILEWSADLNCDGYEELLIRYELGNTIYKKFIGSDVNGNYKLVASDSLYWD